MGGWVGGWVDRLGQQGQGHLARPRDVVHHRVRHRCTTRGGGRLRRLGFAHLVRERKGV